MTRRNARWMALIAAVLLAPWLAAPPVPVEAHWADQAAAEIVVTGASARVTLTLPTGLVAFADDAHAGRLTGDEIRAHREDLRRFLSAHLRLSARLRTPAAEVREGVLAVRPFAGSPAMSGPAGLAPATHTTLALVYTWPAPVDRLTIRYDLFLPGASTASCLATILADGRVHNVAFTP
ncbi:MAG TPA: hypothetical protein VGX75_14535, partial [bacterium]|nr:hypothetical protein [bacterium]